MAERRTGRIAYPTDGEDGWHRAGRLWLDDSGTFSEIVGAGLPAKTLAVLLEGIHGTTAGARQRQTARRRRRSRASPLPQ